MQKITKSIYEKIIPFHLSKWLFWPLIGTVTFFIGILIINLSKETGYFWTQIFFTGMSIGIPLVFIWLNDNFRAALYPLSNILWNDSADFDSWVETRKRRLFTFESPVAKLLIVLAVALALITIFLLGLPFKSLGVNIIALIGFAFLTIENAHSAYTFLDFLITAHEIANRPINPPFYINTKYVISKLQNYYSSLTLFITGGYFAMAIAIWQGPYGITPELQIWLSFGAFYPLASFFWLFFQSHVIMQRIKHANLVAINQEIQTTYAQTMSKKSNEKLEQLSKIMELQDKVALLPEWPIELQGTITFAIAFITAIIQVFVSVSGLFRP